MLVLVAGGSGSGKSAYAEQRLAEFKDVQANYYLAAMMVYDEEGRKKVQRHRELRRDKGFLTIEQPRDIEKAIEKMIENTAILLECMSNLVANEMFAGTTYPADAVVKKIIEGIRCLRAGVKHMVIVTNNVFEDGICYDAAVTEYQNALAAVNRMLAELADEVVEVTAGIPVVLHSRLDSF